jgi:hypothetical protein
MNRLLTKENTTMTRARILVVGAGFLTLGLTACDMTLTELNRNPNNPEDVPVSTLFTTATQTTVGRFLGAGYSLRATDLLAQHVAQVQYPDEDTFARLVGSATTGYFDGPYVSELEDLTKVIKKSGTTDPGASAPAQVMRAWVFSYLTNTFGDIPYTQSLAGDSVGGSLAPSYTLQSDIYTDLFARLTAASNDLTTATNTLEDADPIYGGDPALWQKFANSLRARLALTLVNQNPALANTELTAALAAPGGIIDEASETAMLVWPGDGLYNNPWSNNFVGRDDHRVSKTMMEILSNTSDPRVAVFAMPANRDTAPDSKIFKYCTGAPPCFVGLQNGLSQSTAGPFVPYTSRPGAVFYPGTTVYGTFGGDGASFPSFVFTAAEGNFIKAEAANRNIGGLNAAQAAGFYNAGITESMNQWGITNAATIATYTAGANVAYVAGNPGLVRIAIQKWLALYTDGGTAWTEWRRTCQPASIIAGPGAIQSTMPRRFQYSDTEYTSNRLNVQAAVGVQGADTFDTRVYFDRTPAAAPQYPGAAACLGD